LYVSFYSDYLITIGNMIEELEGLKEPLVLLTQKNLAGCQVHLKLKYKVTQILLPRSKSIVRGRWVVAGLSLRTSVFNPSVPDLPIWDLLEEMALGQVSL